MLYYLNPIDEHVVGWIGGNAPDWFDNISTVPLGDRGEIPFITIGEDVDYVQDEEYYWNHLIRDGYRVYGVIDEYAYGPVDERMKMIKGNAPFCNGCVYLYRDDNDEIIVGFWQYS